MDQSVAGDPVDQGKSEQPVGFELVTWTQTLDTNLKSAIIEPHASGVNLNWKVSDRFQFRATTKTAFISNNDYDYHFYSWQY